MSEKKWEYMCQRIEYDRPDIEQGLDEFGEKGWELVGTGKIRCNFNVVDETLILFFKREVPESIPDPPANYKFSGSDARNPVPLPDPDDYKTLDDPRQ